MKIVLLGIFIQIIFHDTANVEDNPQTITEISKRYDFRQIWRQHSVCGHHSNRKQYWSKQLRAELILLFVALKLLSYRLPFSFPIILLQVQNDAERKELHLDPNRVDGQYPRAD